MHLIVNKKPGGRHPRQFLSFLFIIAILATSFGHRATDSKLALAQGSSSDYLRNNNGIDQANLQVDEQIEQAWHPAYLSIATGDPNLLDHGVYAWPFDLDSIGWSMQSYQDYGGTPYFHHGMDMMKMFGTMVYNRSGGQVINIENYNPGWDLYWEVAILDPDGYIWQYHHINSTTIPEEIWNKYNEYIVDPVNGGFIPADTYIGDIIEWPVWSFGKQFNHVHLNILAAGGVYVNGFEFHTPLPDISGPEIQAVGLEQNGQIHPGDTIMGDYSLYVHARDLILDDVYYLPPWEISFSVDGGPEQITWRFDTLPGGADDTAYLDDFYLVPPTCGDYDCRDYYIDLGFIPDSQFVFPATRGQHVVTALVSDFAGSIDSQTYTYTVLNTAPVANPQTVTIEEDTPQDIVLTGSDYNGDVLTYAVSTSPIHGILGGIAPNLTYTPTVNYYGNDNFRFTVNDGLDSSTPAVVSIHVTPVNDAPEANPQSVTTLQSMPVAIVLSGTDVDRDHLTYSITVPPSHGVLSGTAPNLVYTPEPRYKGMDSCSFIVNDGELDSLSAEVSITINQHTIFVPVILR